MTLEIKTVKLTGVNCYLLKTETGYVLIDTGFSFNRRALARTLEKEGCRPGNLKLIIITHGDFDHTGNCAYLREKYGVKITMHHAESEVVERGNMTLSRDSRQGIIAKAILVFLPLFIFKRFTPDLYIKDGDDFSEYGLDAKVVHLPGHSTGSIGILTSNGDLLCGDLFINNGKPTVNTNADVTTANESVETLRHLDIKTVYPGHGESFPMSSV